MGGGRTRLKTILRESDYGETAAFHRGRKTGEDHQEIRVEALDLREDRNLTPRTSGEK